MKPGAALRSRRYEAGRRIMKLGHYVMKRVMKRFITPNMK
jgi:hypothetical protein